MRKAKGILALLTAAAVVWMVLGCNPEKRFQKRWEKKSKELSESLCQAAGDFNSTLVWKNYDHASNGVLPEKRVEFLEKAERIGSLVNIENFTIATCMVSLEPFVRDEEETEGGAAGEKQAVKPEPEAPGPEGTTEPGPGPLADEAKKSYKIPNVLYGMALVRYINLNVLPSMSVRNRLVKQYWIYFKKDDVWFCDMDIEELLE